MKNRLAGLGLLGLWLSPHAALACGACFAPVTPSTGPTVLPPTVKQEGERVLFVQDPLSKTTRVWIEIRYDGPAQDFAWVLPLPKTPKVSVGNSWLLDRLDLATMPRFATVNGADENCSQWTPPAAKTGATAASTQAPPRAASTSDYAGCGGGFATTSAGYNVTGSQDGGTDSLGTDGPSSDQLPLDDPQGLVHIGAHAQTGPYDYVVVDSKDPTALASWLTGHGYAVPDAAQPLIAAHVQKGDVFLALRLKNGAGIQEIKPVALEMQDADPCVPLRLTSLAAVDDTSVVIYVAGPGRALPKNYLHVVPNPARLTWLAGVGNYEQVLSAAIDEAGGHAFATEFAGNTDGLTVTADSVIAGRRRAYGPQSGLFADGPALTIPDAAADFAPYAAIATVTNLASVLGSQAPTMTDNLAQVLEKHAHLAANLGRTDVTEVYTELESMQLQLTLAQRAWPVDGPGIAADLTAQAPVVGDTEAIAAMEAAILTQPKLTRLAMFISPDEMTKDPIFAFNAGLTDVANRHTAVANGVCTDGWYPFNAVRLQLDGLGSWLFAYAGVLPNTVTDPRFFAAPAALRVELLDEVGPPLVLVPAQVDLVDAAVSGAQVGTPSLPSGLIVQSGQSWQPPASDPVAQGKQYKSGWTLGRSRRPGALLLLLFGATVLFTRRLVRLGRAPDRQP